jgi:hypothetical protein
MILNWMRAKFRVAVAHKMLSSLLYLALCALELFSCFLAIPVINRKLKTDLLIWMKKQTGSSWIKGAIAILAFILISSLFALADQKLQFANRITTLKDLVEAQRDFYIALSCFTLMM